MRHLRDAFRTVFPAADDPHGPLPGLLVLLTVVTGLVDAFSYLRLGHVFVANMTGNVVFLSFDLGGASGFIWWASILAVIFFLAGAYGGGLVARRWGAHRGRHLLVAGTAQAVLLALATVLALVEDMPYRRLELGALIVLLGLGMGLQNATARSLAVPDLTTTVLTLTLTGITSDGAVKGSAGSRLGRRAVSILAMFLGGLVGALLVEGGHGALSLLVATVLLLMVVTGAARSTGAVAEWTHAR